MKIRSKATVWLVSPEEEKLNESKLMSKRQVLSVFFYHHNSLKETMKVLAMSCEKL